MKMKVDWKGPFVVSVTPFDKEGNLDIPSLKECIKYYLDVGVTGIIIGGHNGESWALEEHEFPILVKTAAEIVNGKVPVLVGVVSVTVSQVCRIAKACKEVGASGLMIEPPYVLATSTKEEIIDRYTEICDNVDMPVMIYNNPRRTQITLTPEIVSALADNDKIVAIKDASSNFSNINKLIRTCGGRISYMAGPGEIILPALLVGAKGYITSGAIEVMGKDGVRLYEAAVSGDYKDVLPIHHRLSELYGCLFNYGTWPASLKAAMILKGVPAGYPRSPVHPLSNSEIARLKADMKKIGVI